jgi:hypothetical protein
VKRFRLKLWRLWYKLKKSVSKHPIPFQTIFISELPDDLVSERIYLVGENEYLWSAALLCPCGCKSLIQLNLLSDTEPCWRVKEHFDGTVSLSPSIWSRKRCGSHYFIKRGTIKWHQENN